MALSRTETTALQITATPGQRRAFIEKEATPGAATLGWAFDGRLHYKFIGGKLHFKVPK